MIKANIMPIFNTDRAYSRKQGHVCDFFRKWTRKGLKRAKYLKIWTKTKFANILKSGSLMRETIARMKQLEYAMTDTTIFSKIMLISLIFLWFLIKKFVQSKKHVHKCKCRQL